MLDWLQVGEEGKSASHQGDQFWSREEEGLVAFGEDLLIVGEDWRLD